MRTRLDLQELLENLIESSNVYFQPPPNVNMKYPAIKYSRENIDNRHADNGVYLQQNVYQLTVIDKNPDSEIVKKVSRLPSCSFDRHYISNNLNHDVFTIYF